LALDKMTQLYAHLGVAAEVALAQKLLDQLP
jgi:hypothetical protein